MSSHVRSNMKVDKVPRVVAAAIEGPEDVVPSTAPTCPVCMEPWTCSGAHRICCIPCGHVYGRSCLERWLHRSRLDSAKCPQCSEQFEHKLIINLYAPGNLWDGCCRLQDVKAHYKSKFDGNDKVIREMATTCAHLMSVKEQIKKMVEEETATYADLLEIIGFMEKKIPYNFTNSQSPRSCSHGC